MPLQLVLKILQLPSSIKKQNCLPETQTHTHMPSHLPELPLEIQDIIIKYVLQLEERDKQREAVAHLDGLLDDVVSLLGAQNNAEILHQWLELDIYDIVV